MQARLLRKMLGGKAWFLATFEVMNTATQFTARPGTVMAKKAAPPSAPGLSEPAMSGDCFISVMSSSKSCQLVARWRRLLPLCTVVLKKLSVGFQEKLTVSPSDEPRVDQSLSNFS